jgi:ketosteroid isomerase-like protein
VTEHPNVERVRQLIASFQSADVAVIEGALAPDVVWHFPGRTGQLAGAHTGRDAVFAFLGRVVELTNGTFHLELVDVVANDTRAVVLFNGHGEREQRVLDNPTCLVISMRDGRASEIWEFVWDLEHVEEFWR